MTLRNNWWQSAVIYQIYPRSFKDSNDDGVGDLRGIIQKLSYVTSLGVDAIWISPFYKSPMKDFGYDVSDYRNVDPLFGTLDDFRVLLDEAHDHGLKVIIDQVWSHSSDQHPWFIESSKNRDNLLADWYVWNDPGPDGQPPSNWMSTFGGSAWTWEPQRRQYYLHHFLKEQPALNWRKAEVQEAMLDVGRYWLDIGVDGFRFDVINFLVADQNCRDNPLRSHGMALPDGATAEVPFFSFVNTYNQGRPESVEMVKRIRALLDSYPNRTSLAEVSCAEDAIADAAAYVDAPNKLHMAYNSSLMSEDPLDSARLTGIIERVQHHFREGILCWTAGTHDFPRLASRWHEALMDEHFSQEAFDHQLAALLISLQGSCCIYQGDELGLHQAEIPREMMQDPFGVRGYPLVLGRDGCRTPIPWTIEGAQAGFTKAPQAWLPLPQEHRHMAVEAQERDPQSLLNKYRRLIHWRQNQEALTDGDLQLLPSEDPVLAFCRRAASQTLLFAFNFDSLPTYQSLERWPACAQADELDFQVRCFERTVEIPGLGVFIAVVEPAACSSDP
ncbi:alpha-glucosidase [Cyanobium sp. LEGE 06143]|uniref:alpha-glucosidase n=1 Tax=Cyanobium sp. LEGE 06143 TaxID=945727 RepID=UPI001881DFF4|nr:alpha-glucosidase [Cyanobium sp. LEGE 06143]MBE9171718.1 alpha-glucosidase [Cyanobium sp. LEGE 06143]